MLGWAYYVWLCARTTNRTEPGGGGDWVLLVGEIRSILICVVESGISAGGSDDGWIWRCECWLLTYPSHPSHTRPLPPPDSNAHPTESYRAIRTPSGPNNQRCNFPHPRRNMSASPALCRERGGSSAGCAPLPVCRGPLGRADGGRGDR